jgi:hypothetical protein
MAIDYAWSGPVRRHACATLAGLVGLAGLPSFAVADSMRCGSRIVKDGDSAEKLLQVCGEPASRERTWIQRRPQFELGGWDYSFPGREDVPVDVWVYDFGPSRLRQRVRLIAEVIQTITPLDKGK